MAIFYSYVSLPEGKIQLEKGTWFNRNFQQQAAMVHCRKPNPRCPIVVCCIPIAITPTVYVQAHLFPFELASISAIFWTNHRDTIDGQCDCFVEDFFCFFSDAVPRWQHRLQPCQGQDSHSVLLEAPTSALFSSSGGQLQNKTTMLWCGKSML